jgi:hypothetical protein
MRLTDLQASLLGSLTTQHTSEASERTIKAWGFHKSTINSLWRLSLIEVRRVADGDMWSINDAGRAELKK